MISNLEAAVAVLQTTVAEQNDRIAQLEALAHSHSEEQPVDAPEA